MSFRLCLLVGVALSLSAQAVPAKNHNSVTFDTCRLSYETPPDAECGRLSVPENPAQPTGHKIALNLLRVPAVSDASEDPVFVVVGGPGGAAVRAAHQYLPLFRELQQKRDILFVDQRGTGESNGLKCTFTELQFGQLTDEERYQQARRELAECVAALDADLHFYTTPYAVHDLELVRQALGYKQLNLWGVSYGTRVILEYMRSHPRAVRTAVLDGVAPVALQLPRFTEQDASRALDHVFVECEQSVPCAAAFGDLRSSWITLLDELERKPRRIVLYHPRSQESVPVHLSATVLSGWVRLALYSRELAPVLPKAIKRAVAGDFSVLGSIALLAVEDIAEQVSQGMQMTVLCAEDQAFTSAPKPIGSPEQQRLLRLDRPEVFASFCQQFPPAELPAHYFEPVKSDVPTLLLSGRFDPVTPPRWAEQVAQYLPNSLHLVAPGAHHGVTMHGCTVRLVRRFIEAGDTSAIEPGCIEDIRPRAFFVDAAGPAMALPSEKREDVDD